MTARRRSFLRFTLTAAMLLGLGAVTTVAVAWGCDVTIGAKPPIDDFSRSAAWVESRTGYVYAVDNERQRFGTYWCNINGSAIEIWRVDVDKVTSTRPSAISEIRVLPRLRSRPMPSSLVRSDALHMPGSWARVCCSGWPLRCLWRGRMLTIADYDKGVEFGDVTIGSYRLPRSVLWSGMVVNALFYAAAWWLIFFAPFAIRRVLRRRRGACVKCGYDLAGLAANAACPECGCGRAAEGV